MTAIGRPARQVIIGRVPGQVDGMTAIFIHPVDLLVPVPVGVKKQLPAIRRPGGPEIQCRMPGQIGGLPRCQIHGVYFELPVTGREKGQGPFGDGIRLAKTVVDMTAREGTPSREQQKDRRQRPNENGGSGFHGNKFGNSGQSILIFWDHPPQDFGLGSDRKVFQGL